MEMCRQGDILIRKLSDDFTETCVFMVKDCKISKDGILMKGSMTGHHHKIDWARVFFIKEPSRDSNVFAYLVIDKEAKLTHDEHRPITIPGGVYEVRRQREVTGYVKD